jgi:transketolase
MRNSFVKALEKYNTPNTILVTGDLGFGVLNGYREKFPEQFLNVGVAEQNLTGIAAGLALEGKKVISYSIANFNTLRAIEQIRNDIAYHELNVIIVAVGGGLAYGQLGITHHATEDIAILRSIPNMTILAPGDKNEAYILMKELLANNYGPVYLRIGRAGEASLYQKDDKILNNIKIGKIHPLTCKENAKIALLSMGGMLEIAKKVHLGLLKQNIPSSVYSVHTIKPLDTDYIYDIFKRYDYVFSLEEHSIIGGLSSAILESLAGKNVNISKFTPFALPSIFTSIVGDQNYLRDYYGLSESKILDKIRIIIK